MYQKFIDDCYLKNGKCCAGCDHWAWHNSTVGDCTKSAPVSSEDRISMLNMEATSIKVNAGHIVTKRDHLCGYFVDTYDCDKTTSPFFDDL